MHMRIYSSVLLLMFSGICTAADNPPTRPELSNPDFTLRLAPRTPNQMAAFYEARGFPRFAIDEIRKACFITVGLRNNSDTIVWFDLGNWQFTTPKGSLRRILREDWQARWTQLGLEPRFQSTFRWTLSPEQLDYRPNEREGGNITLTRTEEPITITGQIFVGQQKNKMYDVKFENIYCARD
ncbi:MAG: hypothetical protein GC149_10080 [Gammaproteobacteria bacterium]|nr:hypothetical protein [Gammaproteobacteria bacterium]